MIKLIKPYITFEEVQEDFKGVFDSGIFTRGIHVEALRQEIAEYTGAKHAFLVTSATTALWTCMKLLNIGPGDEVIVSDFSFPATANVVEDLGATPIFADVSLETYNMLPEDLERKITSKTKAVIFVDALGNPTGISEIKNVCEKYGLPLVEDAACAIGSSENGHNCGAIADLTCFSFHPRKLLTTGEGGAITTNRDDWAEWLTIKLAHGASGFKAAALDFIDFGYNFRMSELQAIMARMQLVKLDEIVEQRRLVRDQYNIFLKKLGFKVQEIDANVVHNVQSLVFSVPIGWDRDSLIVFLRENNVESTIGTYAMSETTFFAQKYNAVQKNSKFLNDNLITLPCYAGVDVAFVCEAINRFVENDRLERN